MAANTTVSSSAERDRQTNTPHWLITGATGFIGSALCAHLRGLGIQTTVVSRNPTKATLQLQTRAVASCEAIDSEAHFDAIVHLSGANVFAWPWTNARKKVLRDSRILIAQDLLAFCKRAKQPPKVWIQASAVGFYPTRSDQVLTEDSPAGRGFAAELCRDIEATAARATTFGARVVQLRFGLVMGRGGGVFPTMLLGTKLGGGAVLGRGDQRVGWIHIQDAIGLILQSAENARVSGPVNAIAPDNPSYQEWTRQLAKAANRPLIWRVPAPLLKLVLGERAPLMLEGALIDVKRLREMDLSLLYPSWETALGDLIS